MWDYRTITPIERRPELGDREFYTEEEIAQLEGRAARRMEQPPDENTPANLVHAEYLTDPGRFLDESRRTSLIIDPPNGRMPPLTAGSASAPRPHSRRPGTAAPRRPRRFVHGPPLLERCITRGVCRRAVADALQQQLRITQAPGSVAIVHEMVHETRIVPLDDSPFGNVRSYIGESRGHWEGDTLVVETRNFNGKAPFRGAGANLRVSSATRARRRQSRLQGHVRGRHAVDAALDGGLLHAHGEGELYEYACHEGNYGLRNILENARDEERKAAHGARSMKRRTRSRARRRPALAARRRPASAHHSFAAEFDANQPVSCSGTITKMEWINPHSWLHIDVKNDDGTTTPWMIEGATPNTLLRRGFTREAVKSRHRDHDHRLPGQERREPR